MFKIKDAKTENLSNFELAVWKILQNFPDSHFVLSKNARAEFLVLKIFKASDVDPTNYANKVHKPNPVGVDFFSSPTYGARGKMFD